jgi:hypothetical protein
VLSEEGVGPAPPLQTGSPVRFDLAGEDRKLAARNRSFGEMAAIFWIVFIAIGFLVSLSSGFPPTGDGFLAIGLFSATGSIGFCTWLAFALQRPLADIAIGPDGLSGHNSRGTGFRAAWTDPKLRVTLDHTLGGENASFRTPEIDWRVSIGPSSVSGELPEPCYEYLVGSARRAGLSVLARRH